MSDQLWEIAAALHTVQVNDRKSLDTLSGSITLIIALASYMEQEKGKEKETENG